MADRFVEEATQQIAPVYGQQISAMEAQIPAIQQLYSTLTEGLKTQSNQQLESGITGIVEDASARGVLRSTLPVDSRTTLTAQLGAALNQALGQAGLEQTREIGNVRSTVGNLRISQAKDIADLSNALRTNDLQKQAQEFERQKFEYQKQVDAQNFALESQKLAIQRAAARAASAKSTFNPAIASQIDNVLSRVTGSDGKVSPTDFGQARVMWVSNGGSAQDFNQIFGPKYAEGAGSPIQQYYGTKTY